MLAGRSVRWLDAAIITVVAAIVTLGAFFAWQVYTHRQSVEESTPVSRAIQQLRAAVRQNPNDLDLRMQLAQAYTVAGKDNEAAEQYEAVLKVNKENASAISGLGFLAARQKDWATSEKYWRKVIDLLEDNENAAIDKRLETAYFYLGTSLFEQKQYEEAAGYFKEALRMNRAASDTHFALAITLRELGRDNGYRDEIDATLAFDPKMPEANFEKGKILLADGKEGAAAERFRIAVDGAPNVKEPREALERLGPFEKRIARARELKDSDPKAALDEARVAAALEPRDVEALVLLGELWEKNRNFEKAAEVYRATLTVDASNADAKAGLERVVK